MRIKIVKAGINGEGIGYIDKKPVFVEGALPQEEVEIKITEKNAKYSKAETQHIIKKRPDRVRPSCRYERNCGACTLMCANYQAQLQYKYDILTQSLGKYANVEEWMVNDIEKSPSSIGYRNSLKLPFVMYKDKLTCALYATGSNHPVQI